jgi:hypothetical protein
VSLEGLEKVDRVEMVGMGKWRFDAPWSGRGEPGDSTLKTCLARPNFQNSNGVLSAGSKVMAFSENIVSLGMKGHNINGVA